jgi:hypothetical protein
MTMSVPTPTPVPLPDPRKVANKQRRKAGREVLPCTPFHRVPPLIVSSVTQRHEERKTQTKDLAYHRQWQRTERPGLQEQLRNDGTLAFTGRSFDNTRALASHIRADSDTDDDDDEHEVDEAVIEDVVPQAHSTSGAALLAMARPAKTRRPPLQITDGEAFEVVEIDGRLVALDEDGWEILPDEGAEASLLYSDIVRGSAR